MKEKREHPKIWIEKGIPAFLRENFKAREHSAVRSVYLALCEMEGNFMPHVAYFHIVEEISKLSGVETDLAQEYLQKFIEYNLIQVIFSNTGMFINLYLLDFAGGNYEEGRK